MHPPLLVRPTGDTSLSAALRSGDRRDLESRLLRPQLAESGDKLSRRAFLPEASSADGSGDRVG